MPKKTRIIPLKKPDPDAPKVKRKGRVLKMKKTKGEENE